MRININQRKKQKKMKIALEKTTHTHLLEADEIIETKIDEMTTKLVVKGNGILMHGEHGDIITESPFIIVQNQVERNPLTGIIESAND